MMTIMDDPLHFQHSINIDKLNEINLMLIFDTKIAIKLKVMDLFPKFQLFVLYVHCMVFSWRM